MVYNQEVERVVLSGIMHNQYEAAPLICQIVPKDFYSEDSKLHATIFRIMLSYVNDGSKINETLIAERVKNLSYSFTDDVNISDYLDQISNDKIGHEEFKTAFIELKNMSARRQIVKSAQEMAKMAKSTSNDISGVISSCDRIYNNAIMSASFGDSDTPNLFERMEEIVNFRAENPIEEGFGLLGVFPKIESIYGSLFRPGNITVICARSGAGKTTLALQACTQVADINNVPVIHFDNGEMSLEELAYRQCASMSGVPIHEIENGTWRSNPDYLQKIQSVWPQVKSMEFYYESTSGMSAEEMVNLFKRVYFSKVGRGKQCILSFDYIKSDFSNSGSNNAWLEVSKTVDKFKQLIQREIVDSDGEPLVSMFTSVQANRSGIVGNKSSEHMLDDESTIGLSDGIVQFSSHAFILRKKTTDEFLTHGPEFGTHIMINVKARHLGKDPEGHLEHVIGPDKVARRNFVCFDFDNFFISECGDYRDIVDQKTIANHKLDKSDIEDELVSQF